MSSLFEEGLHWFINAMIDSAGSSSCIEIASGDIQTGKISKLSIESDIVDINVSISEDAALSFTIKASPEVPASAVRMKKVLTKSSCSIFITGNADKLQSRSCIVYLRIPKSLSVLTVESKSGDVSLHGCDSKDTFVTTNSGDILISDHIHPCAVSAKSKDGDVVVNRHHFSKIGKNKLNCRTVSGDIVFDD